MFSHKQLPGFGLALALIAALAACGDPNLLPPATMPVREDTVTLWALTGTPIATASAFDIVRQVEVRTDRSTEFDFAFDFRPDTLGDTIPVLIPRGGLGLGEDAGLLRTTALFDTLRLAPTGGYDYRRAVPVDPEVVVIARSRPQLCNFGLQYPLYAKIQPVIISRTERWMRLRISIDPNCGYRGLGRGIPDL